MNETQESCSGCLARFFTALGVGGLLLFGLLANFGSVKRGAPAFSAPLFIHGLIGLSLLIFLLLICEDLNRGVRSVKVMGLYGAWTFSGGFTVLSLESRLEPANNSARDYPAIYWHLASAWPYLFLIGSIVWLVLSRPRNIDEL